jgi:MtaA/CmuA family methyltransferase
MARLAGEKCDRIPNFSILMTFAARYIGRGMDEFCRDYRVMAEGNIRANEAFGIDLLNTMSDAYRETADFGADIRFPRDRLPVCGHLIATPDDMKKLKPFKIENSARMLDRLHAIELYKREYGGDWPIMGWIEGCGAESADLMGLTELIFALYDEPAMVREMMDICLETAINCIGPQIEAGADIIGAGDAVASVLGPDIYREWILPYERKIFAEIRRRGAKGRLHICGDIGPLLNDLNTCGADIVDIDWMVDFHAARKVIDESIIICGNFDPVSVVQDGTPELVAEAVRSCAEAGGDNCIIMAGCEIPRDTPHANLKAITQTLETL